MEGNIMGLATTKVGWIVDKEQLCPILQHSHQIKVIDQFLKRRWAIIFGQPKCSLSL
jgi:hypothetical protein